MLDSMPTQGGSIRLFRIAGITVFLHWSWFLVAIYEVQVWRSMFSSPVWAVLLYLGLFAMVTLHEFGHALACRQVGGQADQIVLWPLGGIAFVRPPPRAAAMLWSIAAGPLVNLLLLPTLTFVLHFARQAGWMEIHRDAYVVLVWLWRINLGLLLFNLLPIYPLDGGQILRAILWFPLGQIRSLFVATAVGFAGGAALAAFALWQQSLWIGIMAIFLISQAAVGWRQAQFLKLQAAEEEDGAEILIPDQNFPERKTVLWRGRSR
jgi:Zn-dependent protease